MGVLPSDKSKRINAMILTCIWLLTFCDWLCYIIVLNVYTNKKQFKFLWNFNFFQNVFVNLMFLAALALFAFAHCRLMQLHKLLDSRKNKEVLKH